MKESQTVQKWFSRLSPETAKVSQSIFSSFMKYLKENGGSLADLDPDGLVEFQKLCDNGSKYEILDVVQAWILSMGNHRQSYKKRSYAAVKSFFLHNRAPLPKDAAFRIRGDKPKVRGRLTIDIIKNVVLASNVTYRAIFLSMFQGGMGLGEFLEWNQTGLQRLIAELRDNSDLIRIELSGRKHSRNKRNYYTYIGRDALEAIRLYLEKIPRREGVIFINQLGDPVSKNAVKKYWSDKIYKLGYASRTSEPNYQGHRTGMNIHELRDMFRSQWELSPAKGVAAEYFLGHRIDDLDYNKIFDINEKFARQEYRKAEPYLSIMSDDKAFGKIDAEEVDMLKLQVSELQNQMDEYRKMLKLIYDSPELAEKLKQA